MCITYINCIVYLMIDVMINDNILNVMWSIIIMLINQM